MDYDLAYANRPFIPGAEAYPARWEAEAATFRATIGDRARLAIGYGPGPRNTLDLLLPDAPPKGLFVFIHGGYWMAFDRTFWSHLGAGALARGWACAIPSYTLAPAARISAMTDEIARAIEAAADLVAGPIVVAGHSAGGHLAARMACEGRAAPRLLRVAPISPLSDLEPLLHTGMNADLRLDAGEAASESPARLRPSPGVAVHVWVGAQERPAFLFQARLLSEAWACPWTPEAGKHHFDVIDGLADPGSALMNACLGAGA